MLLSQIMMIGCKNLSDLRTRWTETYIEQLEFLKSALLIPETEGRRL